MSGRVTTVFFFFILLLFKQILSFLCLFVATLIKLIKVRETKLKKSTGALDFNKLWKS